MKYTPVSDPQQYGDLEPGDVFRFSDSHTERIKVKGGFINDHWSFNPDRPAVAKVVLLGRIEKKNFKGHTARSNGC